MRDKLVEILLRAVSDGHGLDAREELEELAKYLSVDIVPVVRCKDCKYNGNDEECPMLSMMQYTSIDDFCSYGERKDI